MLTIQNLTKSYAKSGVNALENVCLELRPGEIFGFIGPNGAGKTTAIKILTGILSFDKGTVQICGKDIDRDPIEAKRNIGYVSDSHVIYDKLTGREYIDFLADVYGVGLAERQLHTENLLDRFELRNAFDQPIRSYSHGMKQKISIIGALVHKPKLWVLDEPMTGLDPQSSYQLKELMREHCKEGNTVFFSTHILEVAEKLCDRVGIIVKGKINMVGTLDEIRNASTDSSLEQIFLSITGNAAANGGIGGSHA